MQCAPNPATYVNIILKSRNSCNVTILKLFIWLSVTSASCYYTHSLTTVRFINFRALSLRGNIDRPKHIYINMFFTQRLFLNYIPLIHIFVNIVAFRHFLLLVSKFVHLVTNLCSIWSKPKRYWTSPTNSENCVHVYKNWKVKYQITYIFLKGVSNLNNCFYRISTFFFTFRQNWIQNIL